MNISSGLNTKTVIQHLIFLNEKSIVQVCRDLQVTPQQFSDWIKKRRPIPDKWLNALEKYFGIDKMHLVDANQYARSMSLLSKIEIETLIMSRRLEQGGSEEDRERCRYALEKLKKEKIQQIRIARLSAVLSTSDEKIERVVDIVLDMIEKGDLTLFERLL